MNITSNIRAGSAYVEVTADTGRLNKGLSQAQAQLRAFGQTCTNVGRDLLVLSACFMFGSLGRARQSTPPDRNAQPGDGVRCEIPEESRSGSQIAVAFPCAFW